jgi:phenylalanyl-tRNA synthetase beta subunit
MFKIAPSILSADFGHLAEEVGRFYGYDQLPEAYPRICAGGKLRQPLQDTVSEVERLLQGMGLSESVSLIFVDQAESERLGTPASRCSKVQRSNREGSRS